MTIRAKFPGNCRVCRKSISVGAEIEWQKGAGAMHVACAGKSPEPLNSAPPPAQISQDTDLAALAQQYGFTMRGEPRIRCYERQVAKGDHLAAVGSTFETRDDAKMLVVARTKAQYWSADDLEDQDKFDQRPGLYYSISAIQVERTAAEQSILDAKASAQASANAAQQAEEERRNKHFTALLTPPEGWTMIDGSLLGGDVSLTTERGTEVFAQRPLPVPPKTEWTKLDAETARPGDSNYAALYQAGPYRVLEHGSYDDWRVAVMVPPDLVDTYIAAICVERQITSDTAAAWLAEYRGCVGSQIYEWAVKNLPAKGTKHGEI